jgi:hypothetical protein
VHHQSPDSVPRRQDLKLVGVCYELSAVWASDRTQGRAETAREAFLISYCSKSMPWERTRPTLFIEPKSAEVRRPGTQGCEQPREEQRTLTSSYPLLIVQLEALFSQQPVQPGNSAASSPGC